MPSGSGEISGQRAPEEESLEILHPLDRWPDAGTSMVLAAQWLVILVPGLLVLGQVVGLAWGLDDAGRIEFMQRLLLVTAITQAVQVLWGHRLPGLVGPSAVLIVGVLATIASGPGSVAGAMAVGGGLTALAGIFGLAARLGRLYTPPVLASSLLLVAVSLTPTMRDLLYHAPAEGQAISGSFLFGIGLVLLMLLAQFRLKGLWSSAAVLMGLVAGSLVYYALGLEPWPVWRAGALSGPPSLLPGGLAFEPGVIVAFLLCYLALISNELATIESTGRLIGADKMAARANRGVAVSGLGGVAAGIMGSLGPVTYSVSPAVVVSTKSASRYTLLPAAAATLVLALWPGGLALFGLVPEPVVGAVLLTLMAQSVYASLHVLLPQGSAPSWTSGSILGVALIAGIVVSFMPPEIKANIHPYLRPILGNGFVVGLVLALIMEHVLLRKKGGPKN
ncbi:MAG: purine/pyrimidine permease [Desulfarculaceae bacterium]|nr:purine/pyrimidine permease [Desulfarculaceae bacterium]MCF8073685.1 purine/pyrimidine permease [Desulfarculaceae bacterium]MCF8101926.1 purine/pyrimidine permease [Desulfarculaceae bacterium]MCF8117651.1 purine/pyrimidine permease [Desulfarculaceae bacterium]